MVSSLNCVARVVYSDQFHRSSDRQLIDLIEIDNK